MARLNLFEIRHCIEIEQADGSDGHISSHTDAKEFAREWVELGQNGVARKAFWTVYQADTDGMEDGWLWYAMTDVDTYAEAVAWLAERGITQWTVEAYERGWKEHSRYIETFWSDYFVAEITMQRRIWGKTGELAGVGNGGWSCHLREVGTRRSRCTITN